MTQKAKRELVNMCGKKEKLGKAWENSERREAAAQISAHWAHPRASYLGQKGEKLFCSEQRVEWLIEPPPIASPRLCMCVESERTQQQQRAKDEMRNPSSHSQQKHQSPNTKHSNFLIFNLLLFPDNKEGFSITAGTRYHKHGHQNFTSSSHLLIPVN